MELKFRETVYKFKAFEKPGKLHQEMMGFRKKNKLEIGPTSVDDVTGWLIDYC